jgi:hypothetical protein
MSESIRALLTREHAELVTGQRHTWSMRAVIRAAHVLRGTTGDSDDQCRALATVGGIADMSSVHIVDLERRVDLFFEWFLRRLADEGWREGMQ